MSLHDLRRLLLFAVTFALGVAVGYRTTHPLWETLLVGVVGYVICWLLVDQVFAPVRSYRQRRFRDVAPGPDTSNPELPPAPASGRRLDDDRPGWIKDAL